MTAKFRLQYKVTDHAVQGHFVAALCHINVWTFTSSIKTYSRSERQHPVTRLAYEASRPKNINFDVHTVRKINTHLNQSAAFLFPLRRASTAGRKTYGVGDVRLHQSRLLVFLRLQHQPR